MIVIRVYDAAGNVIEAHETHWRLQRVVGFVRIRSTPTIKQLFCLAVAGSQR
jgi:hypothetical protein